MKKTYALALSMILCCVSLILLLLFNGFLILILSFFLMGGAYLTWSLMGAVVGPLAPESIRARWISVPQTVSMFSSFIAPYIGGILYSRSPYYPFIVAIVITPLIALLTFTKLFEE